MDLSGTVLGHFFDFQLELILKIKTCNISNESFKRCFEKVFSLLLFVLHIER